MSDKISNKYDVIIVGCGIAGSVAGAILTQLEHKKVIVLERADRIGGRAASFRGESIRNIRDYQRALAFAGNTRCSERSEPDLSEIIKKRLLDGYVLEAGGRAGWFTNKGKVSYILSAFNLPTIFYPNVGFVWFDREWKPYNVVRGIRYGWMSEEDYAEQRKVTKRMVGIPTAQEAKKYNHVSLKDYCEQITSNEKALEWHFSLGTAHTYINDPSLISAGENIQDILMSRGMEVHITKGGWSFAGAPGHRFIVESFADVIRDNGGEIVTKARVKEISVQNGRVTGVVTEIGDETREIKAPIVVSTASAKELLRLLPEKTLPDDFRIKSERTINPGVVTLNIGLKRPLFSFCRLNVDHRSFLTSPILVRQEEGYRGHVPVIGYDHSSIAPTVAPEGKYLGVLASNIMDYEVRDKRKVDRVMDGILEFADIAFPGWRNALEWMLFHITETATRVKPIDDERLDMQDIKCPSVEGLYLTGEIFGVGIDNASHSALVCAGAITGKDYSEMLPPALR